MHLKRCKANGSTYGYEDFLSNTENAMEENWSDMLDSTVDLYSIERMNTKYIKIIVNKSCTKGMIGFLLS